MSTRMSTRARFGRGFRTFYACSERQLAGSVVLRITAIFYGGSFDNPFDLVLALDHLIVGRARERKRDAPCALRCGGLTSSTGAGSTVPPDRR